MTRWVHPIRMQVWSVVFFVKKFSCTGDNKAFMTPVGSFVVNDRKTRMYGGPLSVFPLVGKDQLEITVNCELYRCSILAGLFLCLKLNILMYFTWPKPRCSALCKPKALIAFKLDPVTLFSINMLILLKNTDVTKKWVVLPQVVTPIWNHDKCWHMAIACTASPHSYLAVKTSSF